MFHVRISMCKRFVRIGRAFEGQKGLNSYHLTYLANWRLFEIRFSNRYLKM